MALPVDVGQELLNVPFGDMITEMALAIAESQLELDLNSIQVATALAETTLDANTVVVAIEEKVDADGQIIESKPVLNSAPLSLLAFGLNPTFYQFAESIIDVKMDITMRSSSEFQLSNTTSFKVRNQFNVKGSAQTGGLAAFLFGKAKTSISNTTTTAFSTTVNARYTNKFSVEAHGTSQLKTTLVPVPPPERSVPRIKTSVDDGSD